VRSYKSLVIMGDARRGGEGFSEDGVETIRIKKIVPGFQITRMYGEGWTRQEGET